MCIRDRYVATLEQEIDSLKVALDEVTGMLQAKISYIDALPSVRLKRWLLGLRGKSES